MGQLVGQMALIQDLAQRQEELRVLIYKLLQDNQVGQTTRVEDQVIIQPPLRQEDKGKAPQLASGHKPNNNLASVNRVIGVSKIRLEDSSLRLTYRHL